MMLAALGSNAGNAPGYLGSDVGHTIVKFLPPAATPMAHSVDTLFFWMVGISGVVAMTLTVVIGVLMIRYRRGKKVNRDFHVSKKRELWTEFFWTLPVFLAFLAFFYAGANIYVKAFTKPNDPIHIDVTGKQWMWKFEHPNGAREINTLHVPVDRIVELDMTSTDVIHDVDIPAFRIKHDVLPGTHMFLWFKATRIGTYDLYCNQFCGLGHSKMRGEVIVMKDADFAQWLDDQQVPNSPAERGAALFRAHGCSGCHMGNSAIHAPDLAGIYGKPVPLSNGKMVIANDAYIRDSILFPSKDIVAGFNNDMPSFRGKLTEGEIQEIISYIKKLHRDYRNQP
ncbi:MAG TPA: cytochrome c oxidase subunit II [Gammaproteobacteria bacterium]|nr:cytochrome c oxidase subunit II [Gammaproteobacteria bacterium]